MGIDMKIYKTEQKVNLGYDTFDLLVVYAKNVEIARNIAPCAFEYISSDWALPEFVSVEYLGEARPDAKQGIICASFNAG